MIELNPCLPPNECRQHQSAESKASQSIEKHLLTNPRLPKLANWICVYCLIVSPIWFSLSLFCWDSSDIATGSPMRGLYVAWDLLRLLLGAGVTTVLFLGGLRLKQLRPNGRLLALIGLYASIAFRLVKVVGGAFLGFLAMMSDSQPSDTASEDPVALVLLLILLLLSLASGLAVTAVEIVGVVWLHRIGKSLPVENGVVQDRPERRLGSPASSMNKGSGPSTSAVTVTRQHDAEPLQQVTESHQAAISTKPPGTSASFDTGANLTDERQGSATPPTASGSTETTGRPSPVSLENLQTWHLVAGSVAFAFLVLLLIYGFVLVVWMLFAAAILAAILFAVGAVGLSQASDPEDGLTWRQSACSAGFFVVAAILLYGWGKSWDVQIVKLPKNADARQITEAYRGRVASVVLEYVAQQAGGQGQTETATGVGAGSGILLANDQGRGLILTNRHVVDPTYAYDEPDPPPVVLGSAARVKLASEDEWYPASIVAIHNLLDLAIIVVDRRFKHRTAVRVASRFMIHQGESVVALGNPHELEFVTTEGIISKVGDGVLVTSCPISPGNSGGPLILKHRGLVAGINTASRRDAQNMNFAVLAQYGINRYPPPVGDRKPSSNQVDQIKRKAIEQVFGRSDIAADNWSWLSHRDVAIELLEMVPIVSDE
jgi:S1-C subfamily serine protease